MGVCGALFGRGVNVSLAERTMLVHENHVQLAERIVEGAIQKAANIINNETQLVHSRDDIIQLRTPNHRTKQSYFQDNRLGCLQCAAGSVKHLDFRTLDVNFHEIRADEIPASAEVVDGYDRDLPGYTVDNWALNLLEKT